MMTISPATLIKPLALLIAGLTAGNALAQTGQPADALKTVVVTASGFEQEIKDAPASISVIGKEDLDNKFYRNVIDALQDAPGVIVTGGGDSQDISLRGMGSQYTLMLVDGKRQSSRETRTNSDSGGVEGGWTPPIAAIERIEIVRGPMSSLYGSDAIGGVINIITRKVPKDWGGEVRLDSTLQERSESGNIYQGNFYLGGPIKTDTLGVQIYGQYSEREEDEIFSGYRERKSNNVTAKLAYTPNENHDIEFEAGTSRQRVYSTLGKTVAPLAAGEACGRNGCPASSFTDYQNTKWQLSHTGRFTESISDSYIKYEEFDNLARQMKIRNTDAQSNFTTVYADVHTVTTGVAYNYQDLSDQTGNQLATGITDIDRYQWSVFAEDEWQLLDSFALTGGLRYDKDENYGDHFSPRIYGVWHVAEAWTLKGGVSTGFRAPDLRQTVPGWGQVSRGGNMYGNPNLEAEKSISNEIGIHYGSEGGLNASFTVFYNDFDDKITRVACPETQCTEGPNQFGSNPTTYVNVDKAITQGVEATIKLPLTATLSLKGNYTYTDSEQKSGPNQGQPLNQLPEHLLHATLDWKPSDALSAWARVNYRGKESQPITAASASTTRAPSYTFVDTGATWHFDKSLSFSAGIYNLLDKELDIDEYGYIEDGRRYWLGATYTF
ncbi:ligand-gated channel protein [Cellvibrio polysaccharolyticus]|uniref:Ligand-gated channel protein n=1 Tax=Cellvibrio polysaccharolyticus TaxID=2082724 RepID=A0A928YUZ3_9GAMM|nr:ligand-gated channel protein [Cellvibrio polysaccharolyticus]MBE8718484.1 ligand-gated channel protein [Cellvibrio polysaccharolyticus]